jgi:ribonuclease HI
VQARQVAGLDNVIAPRLLHHNNVKDVIFEVCAGENQQIAGAVAVLLWSIWNNRNNCVWNEIKETGRSIGFTAWQVWHDWYTVHHIQQQAGSSQQQHQSLEWQKPDTDWYKCNVDAGFHNAINKTSIGWCLRNCRGSFVLAGTMWKDGICSIVEGESIAILEAMKVITQKGISNVIFETDSKSTVDAIHALRGGNSEFCSFICHIQNVLSCNQNFLVKFIKRQANMVAHTLARAAIAWASRCIFETLPLCISLLLHNEMI